MTQIAGTYFFHVNYGDSHVQKYYKIKKEYFITEEETKMIY